MTGSNCPTSERLRGFVLGELSEPELESIASHLRVCSACVEKADSFNGESDPVLAALRQPQRVAKTGNAAYERAVAQLLADAPIPESHPTPPTIGPGTILREYKLLEKVGEGGMGSVYRALHTRIEKEVALKVLTTRRMNDPEARARFEREMRAAGRFRHPNIVQATDAGEANGVHFLVMEFVPGKDLASVVRQNGPLAIVDACELIRQAVNGLHHAHEHGLVHRDIKPSNLRVTPEGELKILDLGLALFRGDPQPTTTTTPILPNETTLSGENVLTSASHVLGTNDYMAPEQWQDAHAVDARADVYSVGCTLWYLLTARPPGRPGAGRVPLRAARPEAPESLERLISQMLADRPADRPAASAVAQELRSFAWGAAPDRLVTSPPPFVDAQLFVPTIQSLKSRGVFSRNRLIRIGLAICIVFVGAVWLGSGNGKGETSVAATSPEPVPESAGVGREAPKPGRLPMNELEARELQRVWAEHLGRNIVERNVEGMEFALIPPGQLDMAAESRAVVSRPYRLGVTEVTRGQFGKFIAATKHVTEAERNGRGGLLHMPPIREALGQVHRERQDPGQIWSTPGYRTVTDDHPVGQVSWDDATAFCGWLTAVDGRKHRLPTEAEWQWAARAGCALDFPGIQRNGQEPTQIGNWAWMHTNSKQPMPVKQLLPNAWGLFDCLGNVEEWCEDWRDAYPIGVLVDPRGPDKGAIKVTCGGAYNIIAAFVTRGGGHARTAKAHIGFRVLREE